MEGGIRTQTWGRPTRRVFLKHIFCSQFQKSRNVVTLKHNLQSEKKRDGPFLPNKVTANNSSDR